MDLLSRLIAGSIASSPTKQKLNTPQERLQACKRICTSLQQVWRNGTRLSDDSAASGHVASYLNRLNIILQDESRKAAPHSCLLHAVSTQIYIIVTKLALSSDSPAIISEATQFFHLLINGEAEGLLDSKIFARALIDLVRRSTIFATIVVDGQGEADLVELLFEIATKIRLDPDTLPGWFYPERDQARSKMAGSEARRSQFPLFYLLVDYVHHDGPTGDFARTGLLYLTETATRSKPLEKWMIESDLAPQMASGLCALYSRLSRQVPAIGNGESMVPIVALSDPVGEEADTDYTQQEAQQSVKAFLSYLAFWQDTLNHCKSAEVKDTLLDHFQVLFVEQLLYPSLLESSDVAGGSTSAVILHLYRLLDAVQYQPLLKRLLQYLLASGRTDTRPPQSKHSRARVSISRQQSIDQLASMATQSDAPSPDLFNLIDLLVISLHSKHSQTVNASLKLITVILRQHHHYVLHDLFAVQPIAASDNLQTLDGFNDMLVQFFDLAALLSDNPDADQSYEAALNDSRRLLEWHSCLLDKSSRSPSAEWPSDILLITADCRLFIALSDSLANFFRNDPITNIALTETFVALATCEYICMRRWIGPDESRHTLDSASIFVVLQQLVSQVQQWRAQFSEWNALFLHQKVKLIDEDEESSHPTIRSMSLQSRTSSAAGRSPRMGPIEPPSTPTRTSTPRGRKMPASAFASIDGALASPTAPGASPTKNIAGSPLHQTTFISDMGGKPDTTNATSGPPSMVNLSLLKQQVRLPDRDAQDIALRLPARMENLRVGHAGSGALTPQTNASISGTATPAQQDRERSTASLGHIITNAIILQEFILELAALLQIRGALFDEVDLA